MADTWLWRAIDTQSFGHACTGREGSTVMAVLIGFSMSLDDHDLVWPLM